MEPGARIGRGSRERLGSLSKGGCPVDESGVRIRDFPSIVDNLQEILSRSNRQIEAQPEPLEPLSDCAFFGTPAPPGGKSEGPRSARRYSFVSSRAITTRWIWFVPS